MGETTYGSVCSGIEAATTAWHPLGWSPRWFAEIEPFPGAVLVHHWPEVPNLGDFTLIRDRIATGEVEAPDVLVGGTPCQAFSVAGLRQSLDDKRGQLTLEFVRLADALDSARSLRGKRPVTIVWENVPGVLNTPDNAFWCFLAGLVGEDDPLEPPGGRWTNASYVRGPRRAAAWRILDAQYFGVAQRRRRVFLVASAGDLRPEQVLFELDSVRRDSPPSREAEQGIAHDVVPCLTSGGRGVERTGETRGQDPVVAVAPTLQANGKAAGSATQQDAENRALVCCATGDVFHALRTEGHDASEDGTGRGVGAIAVPILEVGKRTGTSTTDPRAGLGIAEDGEPMYTLQAGAQHGVAVAFQGRGSNLDLGQDVTGTIGTNSDRASGGAPCIAFDSRQDSVSSSHVFGSLGSSLPQAQAVAVALRGREGGATAEVGDDAAFTLRASYGGGDKPLAMVGMQVRRLTPTECERLQGFPDGHTLIPWRGKSADECPDGPRYKALGNSMAVPVMHWIGARISRALENPS